MARPPFDPSRVTGPVDEEPLDRLNRTSGRDRRPFTVTQLSRIIQRTLEDGIPSSIRVSGEVSNFNTRNHWYFSLKDAASVVSCVAWASTARKFRFQPGDGQQVVATGHIGHYAPQGRTQFYVSRLEPVGAGALELRFRELCDELRQKGYFAESRKRPLPTVPRRIAVITSASGAAWQDVVATSSHRCKAVGLFLLDVRVQGEGAAEDVVRAIQTANAKRSELEIEAILVTRGGGSIEDLWPFNERVVADAVFHSKLPVVAAIGHESDTTIIELVADLRAATPTQAAMRMVPDEADLLRQLDHLRARLRHFNSRCLDRAHQQLQSIERVEVLRAPCSMLDRARNRLEELANRLRSTVEYTQQARSLSIEQLRRKVEQARPVQVLARRQARLHVAERRLRLAAMARQKQADLIEPLLRTLRSSTRRRLSVEQARLQSFDRRLRGVEVYRVLQRGFTYTTSAGGKLVTSTTDVREGELMNTHVSNGVIASIVGGCTPPSRRRSRNHAASTDIGQLDLFKTTQ